MSRTRSSCSPTRCCRTCSTRAARWAKRPGRGIRAAYSSTCRTTRVPSALPTQAALDAGAPAIFEATFIADDTFVAIDVLEKQRDGYHLTEVKSSSSLKEEHIPDVAIQARVAAACDVRITAAAV